MVGYTGYRHGVGDHDHGVLFRSKKKIEDPPCKYLCSIRHKSPLK